MEELNLAKTRLNFLCTCGGVPEERIIAAIEKNGARSLADIQKQTGACMNCCNCEPQILRILKEHAPGDE